MNTIELPLGFKNENDGNEVVGSYIQSKLPFAAGKLGSVETGVLAWYLRYIKNQPSPRIWNTDDFYSFSDSAGVYPQDPNYYCEVCEIILSALDDIDIIGLWNWGQGEELIIPNFCRSSEYVHPRTFEPFWFKENSWTNFLKNKTILVISSFAESIAIQSNNLNLIWPNGLFPDVNIKTYRVPFNTTMSGTVPKETWSEKLEQMKFEISQIEFDIGFVGAGAWSLPIVSHIKNQGKSGIHMGGGLQILFGIIGKRWAEREDFQVMFNEHWITPLDKDIPPLVKAYRSGTWFPNRADPNNVDIDAYW